MFNTLNRQGRIADAGLVRRARGPLPAITMPGTGERAILVRPAGAAAEGVEPRGLPVPVGAKEFNERAGITRLLRRAAGCWGEFSQPFAHHIGSIRLCGHGSASGYPVRGTSCQLQRENMYMPPLLAPIQGDVTHFEVFEATSSWQRRDAARMPWALHRRDRRWTPPLVREWPPVATPTHDRRAAQPPHALFLAESRNLGLGDLIAGRLAVWADPQGADGCFGLFEAINHPELTEALFSAAETWLFEHAPGLRGVRGPLSREPFGPTGLLVDGFDAQPTAFLPYNPPYYPELLLLTGYEPGPAQHAYALDLTMARADGGAGVRVFGAADWPAWAPAVAELYEQAAHGQASQPGADVGLTRGAEAPRALANLLAHREQGELGPEARLALRWLQRRLLVAIAEDAGRPIGAVLAAPDISRALRRANGRLLPFGWLPYALAVRGTRRLHCWPAAVLPAWPGDAVSSSLYRALFGAALAAGFTSAVVGPLAGGDAASAQAMMALGARLCSTYSVYTKTF